MVKPQRSALAIFVPPFCLFVMIVLLLFKKTEIIIHYWAWPFICVFSFVHFWYATSSLFSKFKTFRITSLFLSTFFTLVAYALLYEYSGIKIEKIEHKDDFFNSLYFSIVTFTTLGYGDISPLEPARFIATSETFIGYFYLGILISTFTSYKSKECPDRSIQ